MPSVGGASAHEEVERWRALVDQIPAMVSYWDRELRNVVANATYEPWFGLTPDQIRGMHLRDVLGPAAYRANLPRLTAALAGDQQHFERALVTADGETRHVRVDYVPDADDDGDVHGLYVLVADITDEHRVHRDLVAAQTLARTGSYTIEPATATLRLSPQLLSILGHDPDGPGLTLAEYLATVHPEDRELIEAVRSQAARGEEYEASYRIIRPDGLVRHVHSRTTQVRGDDGRVLLLRGVMRDVTEEWALAEDLGAKNRLLTDLIGMLGHDLSQPVAATNGYLEILDAEWDRTDDAARRDLLRRATRAGRRMQSLLSDILTLVNVESSAIPTRPEPTDVVQVVVEAAHHLGMELTTTGEAVAWVDPLHLGRMVDNLLTNAGRYGRPPYLVRIAQVGEEVSLTFRDHGEGVPQDFEEHLFERFSRAASGVAATVRGTGLGLHLVHELAHANGGTVRHVRPDDGPGATFELRLPGGAPG